MAWPISLCADPPPARLVPCLPPVPPGPSRYP